MSYNIIKDKEIQRLLKKLEHTLGAKITVNKIPIRRGETLKETRKRLMPKYKI